MGKTNLGRVTFVPCGAYSNETAYKRLDVVEHEGNSFLFLKDSTGVVPTGDNVVTMFLAKKGKDFTYDDFTPEQLAALKGEKGDKGDPGKGLTILGYYGTLDLLKAAVTAPEPGDTYGIGTAAPYDIYVFDGVTNDWVDNGKLSGGGEGGGNVVLIPYTVMALTNTSTSVEILTVFGGKEAFIDVVTRVKEGAIVAINIKEGDGEIYIPVPMIGAVVDAGNNSYTLSFIAIDASPASKNYTALISLVGDVATIEKSNYPYGYANIVSIPPDVMSLSNESTSDEIKTAFGGKPAFDAIIEKVRAGNAVGIISDVDVSNLVSQIGLGGYVDSDNCALSFNAIGGGAVFIVNIEVVNGVFSCDYSIHPLLFGSSLVSDPAVGGTDKPASAEAVKKVNDKVVTLPYDIYVANDYSTHSELMTMFGSVNNLYRIALNIESGNTGGIYITGDSVFMPEGKKRHIPVTYAECKVTNQSNFLFTVIFAVLSDMGLEVCLRKITVAGGNISVYSQSLS